MCTNYVHHLFMVHTNYMSYCQRNEQMREHRITFRVKKGELSKIQTFIKQNYPEVKTLSQVLRLALDEFLDQNDGEPQK